MPDTEQQATMQFAYLCSPYRCVSTASIQHILNGLCKLYKCLFKS
jgi:hypothetical protein